MVTLRLHKGVKEIQAAKGSTIKIWKIYINLLISNKYKLTIIEARILNLSHSPVLKFNLKKCFFLIAAYLFYSCQPCHRMEMGAGLAKQAKENTSYLEEQPAYEETTSMLLEGKFVVVYLHGLNMDTHESGPLAEAVQRKFEDQVINIQPKCREEWTSARLSIDEQAKKVVAEIKKILRNSYPKYSEEERKALPINIFGYSQGGLVACVLAANYGHELKIKTVISALAPLSGTDVFENTQSDVNAFNTKARPGLEAIGYPTTSLAETKTLGTILNAPVIKTVAHTFFKGIRDMRINSTCTADIKAFIREGKHNIPILLIVGYIDNLSEYFDFKEENKEQVDTFTKAYAKLTTGQEDGAHDILIPVKRQLCRTDSFENLAASKDDPVYPSNVRTYIAKETIHCYNLTPILSDFQVNHGKTLFESEEAIAVITGFIGQHNDLSIER